METLHPGIYKQEIAGNPPVEAVSTSTGAFVGCAERGSLTEASLVTNWNQFVSNYGSYYTNGYLAYAVRSFFENGGSRAYISRVVHYDAEGVKTSAISSGSLLSDDATPATLATISAINDGVWGDDLTVVISDYDDTALTFTLVVNESSIEVERFEEIDLENIESYINNISNYITVTLLSESPTEVTVDEQTVTFSGGDDGLTDITDTDYLGSSSSKTGLYAFDNVNINIVAIPGITTSTVLNGIITYVENRGDCFGILDAPVAKTPTTVLSYKNTEAALVSENCAFYYPWIYATDPIGVGKSPRKSLPPSGFVAGIYARIDNSKGVWKAPGGTDSVLLGALSLEYNVTPSEQDTLNPNMINVIRAMPGNGICVWGARTLKKGDYTYVPVRRTNIFILQSLMTNLNWAVFEPNNSALWNRISASAGTFLAGLKANKGISDYFVICDSTVNTQDVIDAGKLYVDIGIANVNPAEFIIFRLSLI